MTKWVIILSTLVLVMMSTEVESRHYSFPFPLLDSQSRDNAQRLAQLQALRHVDRLQGRLNDFDNISVETGEESDEFSQALHEFQLRTMAEEVIGQSVLETQPTELSEMRQSKEKSSEEMKKKSKEKESKKDKKKNKEKKSKERNSREKKNNKNKGREGFPLTVTTSTLFTSSNSTSSPIHSTSPSTFINTSVENIESSGDYDDEDDNYDNEDYNYLDEYYKYDDEDYKFFDDYDQGDVSLGDLEYLLATNPEFETIKRFVKKRDISR